MRLSFKTGVFLAVLGTAVLIYGQPAFAEATAAANAETTARMNAELEAKRKRAAQNRAAMQQKVKDSNKKYNDMAGIDEEEVDAHVYKMLGEHPDAASAQPVAVDSRATDSRNTVRNKEPNRVTRHAPEKLSLYEEAPSRAAPPYLQDYLEAIHALKKEHEPYSPPPLKQ